MLRRCSTGCARKSGLRERTSDVVCKGSCGMTALLAGKVVIVTGGGNGIGRAYCLGIAREGGTAVVADIDEKAADGVAKAIKDSGGKSLATKVDVANFSSCQDMAQKTLAAHGKID